jgi:tetratricopeptide (TPR) repeat protein
MRSGQPQKAVDLLEPVISRFSNDYGMHANLGTAYHLLGRYADAEKEIARDLEINPDAHFGLEKYHLALLQYLVRDDAYKKQHVYVDEWSRAFFLFPGHFLPRPDGKLDPANTNALDQEQIRRLESELSGYSGEYKTNSWEWNDIQKLENAGYTPPPYRFKWDLAGNTNFEAGIIYMAQMNPQEPACFEMLGIRACQKRDYNLAATAFEKAITLGSLKSDRLQKKVLGLHDYIHKSLVLKLQIYGGLSLIPLLIVFYIYTKIRDYKRRLNIIT